MLVGPEGAGACDGWARVAGKWKKKKTSEKKKAHCFIIFAVKKVGGLGSSAWEEYCKKKGIEKVFDEMKVRRRGFMEKKEPG